MTATPPSEKETGSPVAKAMNMEIKMAAVTNHTCITFSLLKKT
jgi:hypothetical protein